MIQEAPYACRIIRVSSFSYFKKVLDGALNCYVDIGGSIMGTVPRQESVSTIDIIVTVHEFNAPSGTFKMALLICLIFSARLRCAGKIKI
jgi:hypothetical protein